jgi:hypothetical protein
MMKELKPFFAMKETILENLAKASALEPLMMDAESLLLEREPSRLFGNKVAHVNLQTAISEILVNPKDLGSILDHNKKYLSRDTVANIGNRITELKQRVVTHGIPGEVGLTPGFLLKV